MNTQKKKKKIHIDLRKGTDRVTTELGGKGEEGGSDMEEEEEERVSRLKIRVARK